MATRVIGQASPREYVAIVSRPAHPQTSHADVVGVPAAVHRTDVRVEKLVDEVVDNPSSDRAIIGLPWPLNRLRGPRREDRQPAIQAHSSGMFSAWAGTGPLNPRSPAPAREAGIDGE